MMRKRLIQLFGLLVCLLVASCGPFQQSGTTEAPRAPSGGAGKWQTVWVDPQIIESGSNFTLIRSDRLDSVAVEKDVDYTHGNTPSLMFHLETSACETTVELLDSKDHRVARLFSRRLQPGHYKVSFDGRGVSPGVYSLRALYCGRTAKKTFAVTS